MLAKGCLACRRQSHLQTPSTSPTSGQRCADSTTRLSKWQIPTFSPWVERDSARPHLPKNKSAQTPGKITVSENQRTQEKDHPCNVESLPSARIHKNSYDLFKHVQFQEVKGLPSNMPASYDWEPPASTLAHCLAVIHPKNPDVLAKGCLACRRQRRLQNSQHEPHTRPTVCGLNN